MLYILFLSFMMNSELVHLQLHSQLSAILRDFFFPMTLPSALSVLGVLSFELCGLHIYESTKVDGPLKLVRCNSCVLLIRCTTHCQPSIQDLIAVCNKTCSPSLSHRFSALRPIVGFCSRIYMLSKISSVIPNFSGNCK